MRFSHICFDTHIGDLGKTWEKKKTPPPRLGKGSSVRGYAPHSSAIFRQVCLAQPFVGMAPTQRSTGSYSDGTPRQARLMKTRLYRSNCTTPSRTWPWGRGCVRSLPHARAVHAHGPTERPARRCHRLYGVALHELSRPLLDRHPCGCWHHRPHAAKESTRYRDRVSSLMEHHAVEERGHDRVENRYGSRHGVGGCQPRRVRSVDEGRVARRDADDPPHFAVYDERPNYFL